LESITPEQLKIYTHEDMELYKPFVYHFLNKYYLTRSESNNVNSRRNEDYRSFPYNPLSLKHKDMVLVKYNEENEKSIDKIQKKIDDIRDVIGNEYSPKVNKEEFNIENEKVNKLLEERKLYKVVSKDTVQSLVLQFIYHYSSDNNRRNNQHFSSSIRLEKENFLDFLKFIFLTGMVKIDDVYTSQDNKAENLSVASNLLSACIKFDSKEGYEFLKEQGLNEELVDKTSENSFMYLLINKLIGNRHSHLHGWSKYWQETIGQEMPKPQSITKEENKQLKNCKDESERKEQLSNLEWKYERKNQYLTEFIESEEEMYPVLISLLNWVETLTTDFPTLKLFHNIHKNGTDDKGYVTSCYVTEHISLRNLFDLSLKNDESNVDIKKQRIYAIDKFLSREFVNHHFEDESDDLKMTKALVKKNSKKIVGTDENRTLIINKKSLINKEINLKYKKRVYGGYYNSNYSSFLLSHGGSNMLIRTVQVTNYSFDLQHNVDCLTDYVDNGEAYLVLSETNAHHTGSRWEGKNHYDEKYFHAIKLSDFKGDVEALYTTVDKWLDNEMLTKFDIKAIIEKDKEAIKKEMSELAKTMEKLKSLL